MRILVTGGAGYIGSHTAKLLTKRGYEPVVLDNFSTGHRTCKTFGPLIEGNVGDAALVSTLVRDWKIQAVIHFAAHTYVGESMTNPRKYFRNNVLNTLGLLDAILDCGIRYFVFSSTAATYGIPQEVPIPESHPLAPVNAYGETKLIVEKALRWYGEIHNLCWMALRYFNAAGADPDGELGEEHDPETHLIPLVVQAALGQRPNIEIFGTDYPTADGTAIRDYIDVTDLAEAHIAALEHLFNGGRSTALNLGTGQGHSVREVIRSVEKVSGRSINAIEGARRAGDPPVLVANVAEAQRVLRWVPRFSSIEQIVQTAWLWHSSRPVAK